MIKQEVLKILSELRILQDQQNKFTQLVDDFCSVPRCKKGVQAFLDELSSNNDEGAPYLWHTDKLTIAIELTVGKSERNSAYCRSVINDFQKEQRHGQLLFDKRAELANAIVQFFFYIDSELDKSVLEDRRERQVYLRRALARLQTIIQNAPPVVITKDQWPDVEPSKWIDYLCTDLKELTDRIQYSDDDRQCSTVHYDWYNFDNEIVLGSIETFLDYLDTYLNY